MALKGYQKKYLRGLAHSLQPVVQVGQKGPGAALMKSVNEALDTHELIKVKFVDYKDKDDKLAIAQEIEKACGCEMAGMIGHTAIFYRPHKKPEKRRIKVPERQEDRD
ncbi:MAG: ribosome assembly RNA-binding protein YhbY [Desulfatibacillaceae bacterium]